MTPLHILRATGSLEEIIIAGFPLGIMSKATYKLTEFKLHLGDTLVLASDGLSERFNAADEFLGLDRLNAAVTQIDTTNLTAQEILNRIAHIGDAWANGCPPHDDITLVVMRVK